MNAYDSNTEGIKERFEQIDYLIYCSIQNFLLTEKKLKKIDAEVNQILSLYQGDLDKEKLTSQLKALAVMFKDTGITVDSVI